MSKKHYIEIARIILANKNEAIEPDAVTTVDNIARDLAQFFIEDNENFDARRFLAACGVAL